MLPPSTTSVNANVQRAFTLLPGVHTRLVSAFTLIELLTVVLIMSVLFAVAIPLYLSGMKRSAVNTVKANMKIIAHAAQAYYVRTGKYPPDFANSAKDGTAAPAAFIGPEQDLVCMPQGPKGVWYSWKMSDDSFLVTATEDGTDLWGTTGNAYSDAYFRLATSSGGVRGGIFYVQNGAPFN